MSSRRKGGDCGALFVSQMNLISHVAIATNTPVQQVQVLWDSVVYALVESLKADTAVTLPGLLTISPKTQKDGDCKLKVKLDPIFVSKVRADVMSTPAEFPPVLPTIPAAQSPVVEPLPTTSEPSSPIAEKPPKAPPDPQQRIWYMNINGNNLPIRENQLTAQGCTK